MPRVAFTTLGCKVNQCETAVMEGLFKQRGYEVTPFDQVADVYVLNTCSVTHLGERKSRQLIRRAIRLNKQAIVAVTGCYAQVSPEQIEAIAGVNVIVGTQDRHLIVDLVEQVGSSKGITNMVTNIMSANHFEDIPMFDTPEGHTRSFLKIQEGCTNFCTYCIIPYARGPLRSRPLESVIREAKKMVALGFKEIVLTGIHLGAYGRDIGAITLVDAVKAVLSIEGLVQLRLGSVESIEVSDELIDIMLQDNRLCPNLHLPLQAGDDQVLLGMNRHYTLAQYGKLIHNIQGKIHDIGISTDIIVGFPGETVEMFENALQFVAGMDFSRMNIFPYSRRSGTPAADYADQVSADEKKRRVQMMHELAEKKAAEFQERFLKKQLTVLFEPEQDGIAQGFTGNYIRVYASGHNGVQGKLCNVKLEKPYRDGLWGTIID